MRTTDWRTAFDQKRPLAVVADARMPELAGVLSRLYEDWEQPFSVWLTGGNPSITTWAAARNVPVVRLDEQPALGVIVPGMDEPLPLTAGVLETVQLACLAVGRQSREGIWLGGVYSLCYLVPGNELPVNKSHWNQLLLELYRRFQGQPVILPLWHGPSCHLVAGDAWALDEVLLARLPPAAGAFHAGLRRLLLPQAGMSFALPNIETLGDAGISAYRCGTSQRLWHGVWTLPRRRVTLVLDKLRTIILFRFQRYWRQRRAS